VFVLYAGDRHYFVLTQSFYVKSNNCFELYENMERIKAHFLKLS